MRRKEYEPGQFDHSMRKTANMLNAQIAATRTDLQDYTVLIDLRDVKSRLSIVNIDELASELVHTWSDSSFQSPSLRKTLVISVGKNSVQRLMCGDAFCVELGKKESITA